MLSSFVGIEAAQLFSSLGVSIHQVEEAHLPLGNQRHVWVGLQACRVAIACWPNGVASNGIIGQQGTKAVGAYSCH